MKKLSHLLFSYEIMMNIDLPTDSESTNSGARMGVWEGACNKHFHLHIPSRYLLK